jgi:hypothetical protein
MAGIDALALFACSGDRRDAGIFWHGWLRPARIVVK